MLPACRQDLVSAIHIDELLRVKPSCFACLQSCPKNESLQLFYASSDLQRRDLAVLSRGICRALLGTR